MSAAWLDPEQQKILDDAVEGLEHEFGNVDDCVRCMWCESLPHNAKGPCTARIGVAWVKCWACTTGRCQGGCIDGWLPRALEKKA